MVKGRKHQTVWKSHHGSLPDWENKREIIHHKDLNHSNNDIENLEKMTQADHVRLHNPRLGELHSEESKILMAEKAKGNQRALGHKKTEEAKAKISAAGKGNCGTYIRSPETLAKMSQSAKAAAARKKELKDES